MSKPFLYILIRGWKSYHYFDRCVDSVLSQNYSDYTILFIDDNSKYNSTQKNYIKRKLKNHIVIFNKKRKYSLKNAYDAIHTYCQIPSAVVVNLDSDDWFIKKNALRIIATKYQTENCLLTYGDCVITGNSNELFTRSKTRFSDCNKRYPISCVTHNNYRKYLFLPLHPLTWKVWLFKSIPKTSFQDNNGRWFRYCQDQAIFFPLLEISGGKYSIIHQPLYAYNDRSKYNDEKIHLIDQLQDELSLRTSEPLYSLTDKISEPNQPKINNLTQTCNLRYSKICSLPIIGTFFYQLQILLLDLHVTATFSVSSLDKKSRKKLLQKINKNFLQCYCYTWSLGYQLRALDIPIIGKFSSKAQNKTVWNREEIFSLMWSCVFSKVPILPLPKKITLK